MFFVTCFKFYHSKTLILQATADLDKEQNWPPMDEQHMSGNELPILSVMNKNEDSQSRRSSCSVKTTELFSSDIDTDVAGNTSLPFLSAFDMPVSDFENSSFNSERLFTDKDRSDSFRSDTLFESSDEKKFAEYQDGPGIETNINNDEGVRSKLVKEKTVTAVGNEEKHSNKAYATEDAMFTSGSFEISDNDLYDIRGEVADDSGRTESESKTENDNRQLEDDYLDERLDSGTEILGIPASVLKRLKNHNKSATISSVTSLQMFGEGEPKEADSETNVKTAAGSREQKVSSSPSLDSSVRSAVLFGDGEVHLETETRPLSISRTSSAEKPDVGINTQDEDNGRDVPSATSAACVTCESSTSVLYSTIATTMPSTAVPPYNPITAINNLQQHFAQYMAYGFHPQLYPHGVLQQGTGSYITPSDVHGQQRHSPQVRAMQFPTVPCYPPFPYFPHVPGHYGTTLSPPLTENPDQRPPENNNITASVFTDEEGNEEQDLTHRKSLHCGLHSSDEPVPTRNDNDEGIHKEK